MLSLYLAWLGLGVLLWALFFGWWDGWLLLVFRLFAWFFIASHPANVGADALVYGFDRGEIGWLIYLPVVGAVTLVVLLNGRLAELAPGRPW